MTTQDATRLGIPRWMALAAPDDISQIVALVDLLPLRTSSQRRAALRYELRLWRHEAWARWPGKRPKAPACLRPSKVEASSGYREDCGAHRAVRLRLSPERRAEIARVAAAARWLRS